MLPGGETGKKARVLWKHREHSAGLSLEMRQYLKQGGGHCEYEQTFS